MNRWMCVWEDPCLDHQMVSRILDQQNQVISGRRRWVFTRRLCVTAVVAVAFAVGVIIGLLLLPLCNQQQPPSGSEQMWSSNVSHLNSHEGDNERLRTFSELTTKYRWWPLSAAGKKVVQSRLSDNMSASSLVSDGVYWNELVELSLPKGYSEEDHRRWTSFSEQSVVVQVREGCGRMQNRLLVFANGSQACCRYRQNNDQIQGEIFSFHLARLLGLKNLPPASLGLLYGRDWQWRAVRGQLSLAQWNAQKPVVMTQFVKQLLPAYIPPQLRGDRRRLHPQDVSGLSAAQVLELAQWSDLLIFDYLTANLDRVVNNMYNKQWNPDMMDAPAHNLAKEAGTGLLLFLDNESGLLHGYRLLDKYEPYHRATLQALCVFRRSTVQNVRSLLSAPEKLGQRLKEALNSSQPLMMDWLPLLPERSLKVLLQRLSRVEQQVRLCEATYAAEDSLIQPVTL